MSGPYLKLLHMVNIGPWKGPKTVDFLGLFNIIEAPHGEGKSTIINAIASVFENNGADLIHIDCDQAEVHLDLTDGDAFHRQLSRRGNNKGWCSTKDGRKIDKETLIKEFASGATLDPCRLWEQGKTLDGRKKRLEYLLRVLPVTFSPDEIYAITKSTLSEACNLTGFDQYVKGIEERRTNANAVVENHKGTLNTLKSGLAPEGGTDWAAAYRAVHAERLRASQALDSAKDDIAKRDNVAVKAIETARDEALNQLRIEYEAKCQHVRSRAAEDLGQIHENSRGTLGALDQQYHAELERLSSEEATAEANMKAQEREAGIRRKVAEVETTLRRDSIIATSLQDQINQLRDLRKSKLAGAIPIPDLDFVDGDIVYRGVNVDKQLNKAEALLLWMRLAAEIRGPKALPIFVSDHGDGLNNDALMWLKEQCELLGIQVIITRHIEPLGMDGTPNKLRVTDCVAEVSV